MSFLAALLVFLTVVAAVVVLAPLARRDAAAPAADERRAALEEEYEAALAALRELQDAAARGEVEAGAAEQERLRLQGRAARVLALIEQAGPETAARAKAPTVPVLLGLTVAVAVVTVGAFTFLPKWQLAGLAAADARAVRSAVQLPALARRANASGTVEDYLTFARAAFEAGRYEDAGVAYGAILKKNPRHPEALRRLGVLLLQTGEKEREALTFISVSASLDPSNAEGQLFLGYALARAGRDEEALAALERYRTLKPDGRDADELVTALRARVGKGNSAEVTYQQNCASCHGTQGRGGVGPSLRAAQLTREAMASVIRNGAAGMPAFDERELPDAKLDALLDVLRAWQQEQ